MRRDYSDGARQPLPAAPERGCEPCSQRRAGGLRAPPGPGMRPLSGLPGCSRMLALPAPDTDGGSAWLAWPLRPLQRQRQAGPVGAGRELYIYI